MNAKVWSSIIASTLLLTACAHSPSQDSSIRGHAVIGWVSSVPLIPFLIPFDRCER
jgi:hypothetical protein